MIDTRHLVLICVLLAAGLHVGCATAGRASTAAPPPESPITAQAIADAEAERVRCARIEVFAVGREPERRFRVIGAVSADWTFSPEGRERTLRSEACALGADAVVHARETAHRRADGVAWTSATGAAVVYTE